MTYQEIHDEISGLITDAVLELKDEYQTHDKKGNIFTRAWFYKSCIDP